MFRRKTFPVPKRKAISKLSRAGNVCPVCLGIVRCQNSRIKHVDKRFWFKDSLMPGEFGGCIVDNKSVDQFEVICLSIRKGYPTVQRLMRLRNAIRNGEKL